VQPCSRQRPGGECPLGVAGEVGGGQCHRVPRVAIVQGSVSPPKVQFNRLCNLVALDSITDVSVHHDVARIRRGARCAAYDQGCG
jgi:hypothetical protein